VIFYDRRGRGDSTDTTPYSPKREIEDIEALLNEFGGSGYLYGISSGAALALNATRELGGELGSSRSMIQPMIPGMTAAKPPGSTISSLRNCSQAAIGAML
jgi:pimeloyl-ACP methyl ester carboxylesterase